MDIKISKILVSLACLSIMSGFSLAVASNGFSGAFIQNNNDGSQTLLYHVPKEVSQSTKMSHLSSNQMLDLRITLPVQNGTQLDAMLQSLYDPKSPNFHHFISPDQFKQQFGASAVDTQQVKAFLISQGMTVTGVSSNGLVLNVSGNVGLVEHAFGVNINNYQKNDGTTFFATGVEPTIPAQLAGKINSVGGLDNIVRFRAHMHPQAGAPKQIGSGPGGFIAPKDIYNAYNLNTVPSNGGGQNVALFELDGYLQSDITMYEAAFGVPNVPLQNVLIDGFNGKPSGTGGNAEVTLDIELVAAFAPGLKNIYVYQASNTWQAWVDEWTRLANDKDQFGNLLNNVVSCSWGSAEDQYYAPAMAFDNTIFKQMAAQGQGVFVASGDSGAYDDGSTLSVDEPASQPYVTAVGISKLAVNADGSYNSESASLQGGGGISQSHTIPAYQMGMISVASKGSNTMRNVPDVALTADPNTAYAFFISGSWSGYWGSSLAAPIWASFISRVNQADVNAGKPIVGFANPQLYQIAQNSNYKTDFHDITTGNNQYYPAVAGYDLAVGLGSFNGANLYKDLTGNVVLLPPAPVGLSANVINSKVQLTWSASPGASSYNLKRSTVSGGPYITIAGGISVTNFLDSTALPNTVYFYVVSGVNATGEGANSAQVGGISISAPPSPTGLIATAVPAQVNLTWNGVGGATYYNVKRSTVSGGPYTTIATSNSAAFTDKLSLVSGTTYYYVVSAVNGAGESANSLPAKVTLIPSAPTGFLAMPGNNQVVLTWNLSAGAVTYNVKRSTVSGSSYTVLITGSAANAFTDLTAKNGVTYYYVVSAVNAGGESPNSNQYMTTPFAPAVPPSGLTATAGQGNVSLKWNAVTGAYWYYISRSTVNGGPYTAIATSTANNFMDSSIANGVTYYYVVSTYIYVNGVGNRSPNSSQVSVTTLAPPAAPTNLLGVPGNGQVSLTWNLSPGALSYNVKRATNNAGPFNIIGSGITIGSFKDSTAINGTAYYYLVTAVNAGGESQPSNHFMTTPFAPAAAPSGLNAAGFKGSIALTWNAVPGAKWYYVLRSTVNGGGYSTIAAAMTNNFIDNAVVKGVKYYYVVSAYINVNGAGSDSPDSTQVSATPS